MSLQWTLIASLLYVEIAIVVLMIIPLISPKRDFYKYIPDKMHRFYQMEVNFQIKILKEHRSAINDIFLWRTVYSAPRVYGEMRKYSDPTVNEQEHGHLDAQMQVHMKLFRAQRNFYISGFTLLLFIIIKKMGVLISTQATLQANNEASMKQAQTATDVANKLMDEKDKKKNDKENKENADLQELEKKEEVINKLKEDLEKAKTDLLRANKDKESMKAQAESVMTEYDRLMEENKKLQENANKSEGLDKKDD